LEARERMGKTSSKVKDRYNAKTYRGYGLRVRKDTPLNCKMEEYIKSGKSLNGLLNILLEEYFKNEVDEK